MRAVVCGGAQSLMSDIKKAPTDAVKISCNHHAALMLDCDYLVSAHKNIRDYIPFLDIEVADITGLMSIGYSGTTGVSFALDRLNADVVYVAGMDLHKTQYYYTHSTTSGQSRTMDEKVGFWVAYREWLGDRARKVRPISGPLVEIFSFADE